MSKIQAMFGERGRRLFDSERTEIDELNAEYAAVAGVHVVGYASGPAGIGEPIVRVEMSPMVHPQYVAVGIGVRIGGKNPQDVEVFPDKTRVRPQVQVFKGDLSGKFVQKYQKYRRVRSTKKEADFEQPMGDLRA